MGIRIQQFAKFDGIRLLSHGFYANAPLICEKHENLVGRVVVGCREEVELVPTGEQREHEYGWCFAVGVSWNRTYSTIPIWFAYKFLN